MSERAPYSRIYWSVVDDPKFADVIDDDRTWALWTRLLMAADQAWPASPMLPYGTHRKSLDTLVRNEIVDLQPGNRYRIHGLDAERERRKQAATRGTPTGTQLGTNRDPDGPRTTGLSRAEQRQDETSRAEQARDPANDYWSITGRYPSDNVLRWLDDLTAQYGVDAVTEHLGARAAEDRSVKTLLGRVGDSLKAQARALDRKERAAEERVVQANQKVRAVSQLVISRHNAGEHEGNPVEGCPSCRRTAA